jgi:hypothetical protein
MNLAQINPSSNEIIPTSTPKLIVGVFIIGGVCLFIYFLLILLETKIKKTLEGKKNGKKPNMRCLPKR